ncbi:MULTISPECIES: helix-turn-helix domain-containing protein [Terasakiella]|nr:MULTISPECIES: transcriptional regulator [Terasakiella]
MPIAELTINEVMVHPLRSEADYDEAIETIEELWGAEPGTDEGDRLDVLMDLVEAYESKYHAIDLPDPIEAIKIRMNDLGMNQNALAEVLGVNSGRASELLNKANNRKLTLPMIRKLNEALGLSYDCLCQSYDVKAA